ncbi:MAG TPA: hypothetical protein DD383_00480 [Rikenellaceae bacterium]|nr:hypothetical protein [Rikenellaceae bacterium]
MTQNVLRLDLEWVILFLMKMNQTMPYLALATVAWRAGRPFTRIGRAKRVGRHALQATVPLTEDSHVAASGNGAGKSKRITIFVLQLPM